MSLPSDNSIFWLETNQIHDVEVHLPSVNILLHHDDDDDGDNMMVFGGDDGGDGDIWWFWWWWWGWGDNDDDGDGEIFVLDLYSYKALSIPCFVLSTQQVCAGLRELWFHFFDEKMGFSSKNSWGNFWLIWCCCHNHRDRMSLSIRNQFLVVRLCTNPGVTFFFG